MSIKKRQTKNGFSWEFCIDIQKNPRKQYRKSGFKTKREAEEAEFEAKKMFNAGVCVSYNRKTLLDIKERFLLSKELETSTKDKYDCFYRLYITPYFKQKEVKDITPADVDSWLAWLKREKVSVSNINETIKLAKAMCNYMCKKKYISFNPFQYAEKLKYIKKEINPFSQRQKERFLRRAKIKEKPIYYMFFLLAFNTGMRAGELLGLDTANIDFSKGQIKVCQQIPKDKILRTSLKTLSSHRIIDVDKETMRELNNFINQNNIKGLIFKSEQGKILDLGNIRLRHFKVLLDSLKFANFRIHDMRHTYASILLSHGINYLYVSKQMGHSKPTTTLNIYAHYIPNCIDKNMLDILNSPNKDIIDLKAYKIQKKRA